MSGLRPIPYAACFFSNLEVMACSEIDAFQEQNDAEIEACPDSSNHFGDYFE